MAITSIERLEAFPVVIPLTEPIKVFGKVIREWEFVFVRVYSADRMGTGFGFSRGLLLDQIVLRQIAPSIIGQPLGSQQRTGIRPASQCAWSAISGTAVGI